MFDLFSLTFKNIFAKKLRTILTVLGVCVGVASVMLINTVSDTGVKTVNAELDSLGLNGITVSPNKSDITNDDLELISEQDGVKTAMPILTKQSTVSDNNFNENVILWGVGKEAEQVISIDIDYGREFQNYDIKSKSNVCIIDENIALSIFKRKNVVGKNISLLVGNSFENYEIIGVSKAGSGILQSIMGDIVPNFCYIPYSSMQNSLNTNNLYEIAVKLDDNASTQTVSSNIKTILDKDKGITDSVTTGDLAASRSTLNSLLETIKVVFSIIGIISLFVSGIGIMTVMLVSVNERTREIGIKKAIGASFSNIMGEFIFEALTICIIGSIIGSVLGLSIIYLGGYLMSISVNISLSTLIIPFLSALITGVVFGIYPAFKAAKMKPCEALRYE